MPLYYHSALARSRADWLVGINLSRLFTLLGRRAGYDGVLPVGRVQTPTLRLVVERDRAIAAFVPTPNWEVEVQLPAGGHAFSAKWLPPDQAADGAGRCIQHAVAEQTAQTMLKRGTASALSLDTEHVREAAPLPFDLGTLQDVCSRRFGLGAQEALDIAQSLYETHKATTYPRSDCGHLPDSMFADVSLVLAALATTDPFLLPVLQSLDCSLRSRAWNDAKVTAHHGIIPTTAPVDISRLSDRERAVYELIREYYLAQFLPHHEFDRTEAHLKCAANRLRAVGKQIRVLGWKGLINEPKGDEPAEKSRALPCATTCWCTTTPIRMASIPGMRRAIATACSDLSSWSSDNRNRHWKKQ